MWSHQLRIMAVVILHEPVMIEHIKFVEARSE